MWCGNCNLENVRVQVEDSIRRCPKCDANYEFLMDMADIETGPPIAEVGSTRMGQLFERRVEYYCPTYRGQRFECEGGTTETSVGNVGRVTFAVKCPPWRVMINAGDDSGGHVFLFEWPISEPNQVTPTLVCSGFSVGYGGTGPMGLAAVLAQAGFGDLEELRNTIATLEVAKNEKRILFERDTNNDD